MNFRDLDQVATLVSGQHIESTLYGADESGTPYLTGPADFTVRYPHVSKWTKDPKVLARKTDVLVTVKGAGVGKVNWGCDAAIGRQLMAVRPNAFLLDQAFLFHFLKSQEQTLNRLAQGATVPGIGRDELLKLSLPVPALAEQRRIAEILDKADALRAMRRAVLTQLDTLTQSIFLDMFGPGGLHEKTCSLEPLSAVCRSISDGVHKTPTYLEDGIPFVTVRNITSGVLDLIDTKKIAREDHDLFTKRTKPEKGDVLVSKDGTIGIPCPVETSAAFSIFVSVALLKPKHDVIDQSFLTTQFRSDWIQHQIRASSKGIAVRHLHLEDFKRLLLIVPPLRMQHQFASRSRSLEAQRHLCEGSLRSLNALFASLQHRAFRGEL